jgi:hypothetical protein
VVVVVMVVVVVVAAEAIVVMKIISTLTRINMRLATNYAKSRQNFRKIDSFWSQTSQNVWDIRLHNIAP